MKKIFGQLIKANIRLDKTFFMQKSLYEKISKTFDEFFIINLVHLGQHKKKTLYNNEHFNNILPHNFKVITPINESELNKFLINKNLVAFAGIGKGLNNLKIHFLIKKYNIRLIFLNNIGPGNHYLGEAYSRKWETKILRYYFFRLRKIATYSIFKVLIFLNLFSRIDIYFESTKSIVDNCNNSLAKKIEKIFPFLKICYFKKTIHINSRSFDWLTKTNIKLSEEKIVFLDISIDHGDRVDREGEPEEKLKLKYYIQLNQFLLKLSNIFNKKVTICIHPNTNDEMYKKYLGTFEMCRYQTSENIRQAFIVVFHETSTVYDAYFLKKKIISVKSNTLGNYYLDKIDYYQKQLGLFSYSLEEKKEINKNVLQEHLEKITKNYDHYIKKEMIADASILGEDKIINTIKKEYFVNDKYF